MRQQKQPVDILLPVYKDIACTKACIESVLNSKNKHPFRLIILNDASPEPAIADFLTSLSDSRVQLITNDINLGFTKTVNKGLQLSQNDVVLLNSDTIVVCDWLDQLHHTAYTRRRIATVTPFSNNATLCSFPVGFTENELPKGMSLEAIHQLLKETNHRKKPFPLPTGVGFCMYIKRTCLNKIGLLDEVRFPVGYGEENDFCLRAMEAGWQHVRCSTTYVYHHGSKSFGDKRHELITQGLNIIHTQYPYYKRLLKYLKTSWQLDSLRMASFAALIRQHPLKNVMVVTHPLGGGTEKHIVELAEFTQEKAHYVVLRSTGGANEKLVSIQLSLHPKAEKWIFDLKEKRGFQELIRLCRYLNIDFFHFHHLLNLPPEIQTLPHELGKEYAVTLHDYIMACGAPKTINEHERPLPYPHWREQFDQLLINAKQIICPSLAIKTTFQHCFPKARFTYLPHIERYQTAITNAKPSGRTLEADERFKIVCIGTLGLKKGRWLLQRVSQHPNLHPRIQFTLIGSTDIQDKNFKFKVTGEYQDDALVDHINDTHPHVIWFPALWSETYSYTLSAAMATPYPILAPPLGAFPERLAGRPWTWMVEREHINDPDYFVDMMNQWVEKAEQSTLTCPTNTLVKPIAEASYDDYLSFRKTYSTATDHPQRLFRPAWLTTKIYAFLLRHFYFIS